VATEPAPGSAVPASPAGAAGSTAPAEPPRTSPLVRDAFVTIGTRFALAILIFGTDIVLARLLGPAAKGRFTLVLLYSQLAALILGWGMDQALAVVAGRDVGSARRGLANALWWTAVVGGFGVVLSAWAYGLGHPGPPDGPLVAWLPNLSARQFVYAALAIPGEMFFSIGLFALLGRRLVVAYSAIRILRRLVLLVLVVAIAAVARLSLDIALVMNLVALGLTAFAIAIVAARHGLLTIRPSLPLLGEELAFGTRAVPGALAERLQFRADAFLVNAFLGVRATGIYSVTSGLAEMLWYIPNALGVVMFSRAVDPGADAGRIAAVLTRTTIAVTALLAIPMFFIGPYLVRFFYGPAFADAGVALRWILPGVVAYSAVAVLTRYVTGRGRPGTTTWIMVAGLGVNIAANVALIPRLGINGAALSSSISYGLTAALTVAVFLRLSSRGVLETLIVRPSDVRAAGRAFAALGRRLRGRPVPAGEEAGPALGVTGGDTGAGLVIEERDLGDER
jgi:O-antigen/teichoic acid export membrane protein